MHSVVIHRLCYRQGMAVASLKFRVQRTTQIKGFSRLKDDKCQKLFNIGMGEFTRVLIPMKTDVLNYPVPIRLNGFTGVMSRQHELF